MKPVLRQLDIRDQNSSPRWRRHRTLKTGLNVEKGSRRWKPHPGLKIVVDAGRGSRRWKR